MIVCVSVCVSMYVSVCKRVCVRARMHVRVRVRVEDIIGISAQLVSGSKLLVVTYKLVPSLPIGSYPSILSVWIHDVCVCLSVYPSSCPSGFVFN